jgi:hypothetical protein
MLDGFGNTLTFESLESLHVAIDLLPGRRNAPEWAVLEPEG